MQTQFDPYRDWLHIAPAGESPTHYELLDLPPFADNPQLARSAASQRIAHVRKYQAGKHSEVSIRLMNEISQALTCLTDPASKAAYDRQLRGFATVEDAAAEALFETPPEPQRIDKGLAKLSAAVASLEPPPGAAEYVKTAAATPHPSTKQRHDSPLVAIMAALVVLVSISLVGGYSLYRLLTITGSTLESPPVVQEPDALASPVPTLPAEPPAGVSNATPIVEPAPPPDPPAPAAPPTSAPTQPLLQLGMTGTWEGRLADVYLDRVEKQAHLLLELDAPPDETVEVAINNLESYRTLFTLISDAESNGQGDRLRINGNVIDEETLRFTQRTQRLGIEARLLVSISPRTYGAGTTPFSVGPVKLKAPMSFLMRMRPQPGNTYWFPATFLGANENRKSGGTDVRLTPGLPDAREVAAQFAGVPIEFTVFQPGDSVMVQAEATEAEPPLKLALRLHFMRKAQADSNTSVGSPRPIQVNVEMEMARFLSDLGLELEANANPVAPTPPVTVPGTTQSTTTAVGKAPPPKTAPAPAPAARTDVRAPVAALIKQAQQAIRDKDWATANYVRAELEGGDLNSAEKLAVNRLKRDLTDKASALIVQANKLKNKDLDKYYELLSQAMEIDPDGDAGKRAAKLSE